MPYIFLNSVADLSDFNAPTPIILSGGYFHGPNNIRNKCNSIIKETGCASVSLLCVPLADLLEILETDGFKIVKVNRNGNHFIWILHKGEQSDRKRRVNYFEKQILQIKKENYSFDDISSHSSMDRHFLKKMYEPTTKSEHSQTYSPEMSLIGGGDYNSVDRLNLQSYSDNSNSSNNPPAQTIDKKCFKDSQNQISLDLIKDSTDFECQCNINDNYLLKDNEQIINAQFETKSCTSIVNENRCSKIIVPDKSDNILMKFKQRINENLNCDEIINVKSETIVKTFVKRDKELSKISIHEKKTRIEESNSYLKFASGNFEESPDPTINSSMNKKALDILDKLEKRFQNEHEYFSNARIKNATKANSRSGKKSCKKNKRLDRNSKILSSESKQAIELRHKNNVNGDDTVNDITKKKCLENRKDDTNSVRKGIAFKIMKHPLPEKSLDSDSFYEATDTSDNYDESMGGLGITKSVKSHRSVKVLDLKTIGGTHNFLASHGSKPNRFSSYKKVENPETKINKSQVDCLKNVKNNESSELIKFVNSKEKNETWKKPSVNRESPNGVKYVDHLDNSGKIECSKSHFRISHLEKEKIRDRKPEGGDHLPTSKKQDIFKKKLQFFSNKTQNDFKTRMVERAQRTQQKSLRVTSAGNALREKSCTDSVIESEKDMKNLKKNNIIRNSSLAFSNKDRVHATPISNLKHRTHQRNNLMKS